MRLLFLVALSLLACSADPVLLPDAGPCSSACGAGTVCSGGACVAADAGNDTGVTGTDAECPHPDAQMPCSCGPVSGFRVCGVDLTYSSCQCIFPRPDAGADAGFDGGPADTGVDAGADVPPDTYGACLANGIRECDGRNVDIQGGEQDGGRRHHCGGCGISCAVGEVCDRCVCAR